MTAAHTIFDGHSPLEDPIALILFQMILIIVTWYAKTKPLPFFGL